MLNVWLLYNHGTIKTPIAGREGSVVLNLCKTWAASVGEIRISEEQNPSISIQLSGVDTESIIKQAECEDNRGNRIRLLRQIGGTVPWWRGDRCSCRISVESDCNRLLAAV